jgi:hypothetical protein
MRDSFSAYVERAYNDPVMINTILSMVDFEMWIYEVGLDPTQTLNFTTSQSVEAKNLALSYIALNGTSSPADYKVYNDFYSNLKVIFHDTIQAAIGVNLNIPILQRIDNDLNCTADPDPEVKQRWYSTGLYMNYTNVTEPAHIWISSMGRNKYIMPIY